MHGKGGVGSECSVHQPPRKASSLHASCTSSGLSQPTPQEAVDDLRVILELTDFHMFLLFWSCTFVQCILGGCDFMLLTQHLLLTLDGVGNKIAVTIPVLPSASQTWMEQWTGG